MKTENRPDDSIGALAAWQVQQAIQGQAVDRLTKRILRRALPPLSEAVEALCPAVACMGAEGLQTAYGPYLRGAVGTTFVLANSSGDSLACTADWRGLNSGQPIPDVTGALMRAVAWKSVHDAIRDNEPAVALVFLSGLLGAPGRDALDSMCRTHVSKGWHPAICAIAGKSKDRAAGACCVLALPPSIDLTFADVSAVPS